MGGESECYSCGKNVPYSEIKRCSRCLFTRYCSRECQKTAWANGHKKSCKPHPYAHKKDLEKFSKDWIEVEVDKALSRWLDIWRPVFCQFAMISLDLANHPANRNTTHMMVLWVTPRSFMDDPAQTYGMIRGEVWPLELCDATWPEIGFAPAESLEDNRLRLVVVLENYKGEMRRVRTFTWQTHRMSFFREINKTTSKALATGWDCVLADTVEAGDVATAKKRLKVD
ncbi:hypothetical protein BDN72DRAFT_849031 [Pluteus cervinus]|uniref:Uncharacterized protein n=1 Tax=Pluteus cervinus TaxID=181527 RepID=A0ACD3A914_9AGAR|nr:hypothetical protein BDN72DRAFT_849031 [Pluteus cervinus]